MTYLKWYYLNVAIIFSSFVFFYYGIKFFKIQEKSIFKKLRLPKRVKNYFNLKLSKDLFYPKSIIDDEIIVNITRIVLGLILLDRLINIGPFLLPLDNSFAIVLAYSIQTILSFLFLIGFMTPLTSIALIITNLKISMLTSTYTLGVDVANMMILGMIIYPAGKILSIDSILINKNKKYIINIYNFFSHTNRNYQIYLSKFLPFLSYSLLCLFSGLEHYYDTLWTSGDVGPFLLTSTYLSQYPFFFQELISSSSNFLNFLRVLLIIMMTWYFILLPFYYLGGIFRFFIITWGLLFFFISGFILQLGSLAYIEFIFWVYLFWPYFTKSKIFKQKTVNVLYDDKCNLCDKTINFLNFFDIFKYLKFLPISLYSHKSKDLGVSKDDLLKNIYSWNENDGKIFYGFDFYYLIVKNLPLFWIFYPLFIFFKITKIGYLIYNFIAKYRIQYFGVCKIPTSQRKLDLKYNSLSIIRNFNNTTVNALAATVLIFAIIFITSLPVIGDSFREKMSKFLKGGYYNYLFVSSHILSFAPIHVFNWDDINMTFNYYTISGFDKYGNLNLLPFHNKEGQRLKWLKSDRVYFGNSLKYRRSKNISGELLPISNKDADYICEVAVWGRHFLQYNKFKIEFYKIKKPQLVNKTYKFFKPKNVGSTNINFEDFCEKSSIND